MSTGAKPLGSGSPLISNTQIQEAQLGQPLQDLNNLTHHRNDVFSSALDTLINRVALKALENLLPLNTRRTPQESRPFDWEIQRDFRKDPENLRKQGPFDWQILGRDHENPEKAKPFSWEIRPWF